METYKRFIIFGYTFYPNGGIGDAIGSYDTIEEVKSIVDDTKYDFIDVLDLQERKILVDWKKCL